MNEAERLFKSIGDFCKEVMQDVFRIEKTKTTEEDLGVNKKKIQVELPEPPPSGAFSDCGDNQYNDAIKAWQKDCNAKILAAIPSGYVLKASEIKEERIVRHYADLIVEKS